MQHEKQKEVETLLNNKIPVLLEGPSGSGKTTILMNAAKNAKRPYSFISGTRQTTVSHIIGFMNVNGEYSSTPFRKAYTEGHYFNIDEIDAMDSNVLLIFNSLENDIMYFPDGYSEPPHKDFRFMATANPQDMHHSYVGRNKIDAATLDRFDEVTVDRDSKLESSLVDEETLMYIDLLRQAVEKTNTPVVISMRDSMRYQKRKDLGLIEGFVKKLVRNHEVAEDEFNRLVEAIPKKQNVSSCKDYDDLINLLKARVKQHGDKT